MNPMKMNRWNLFGLIGILYSVCMMLTMLVDWLTSKKVPNPLYYLIVPAFAMLFSAWLIPKVAIRLGQALTFQEAVCLSFGIGLTMQLFEPVEKTLYYFHVPMPGLIYLISNYFLSILFGTYVFLRWGKFIWWKALILAVFNFTAGILAGGVIIAITGLQAPLS